MQQSNPSKMQQSSLPLWVFRVSEDDGATTAGGPRKPRTRPKTFPIWLFRVGVAEGEGDEDEGRTIGLRHQEFKALRDLSPVLHGLVEDLGVDRVCVRVHVRHRSEDPNALVHRAMANATTTANAPAPILLPPWITEASLRAAAHWAAEPYPFWYAHDAELVVAALEVLDFLGVDTPAVKAPAPLKAVPLVRLDVDFASLDRTDAALDVAMRVMQFVSKLTGNGPNRPRRPPRKLTRLALCAERYAHALFIALNRRVRAELTPGYVYHRHRHYDTDGEVDDLNKDDVQDDGRGDDDHAEDEDQTEDEDHAEADEDDAEDDAEDDEDDDDDYDTESEVEDDAAEQLVPPQERQVRAARMLLSLWPLARDALEIGMNEYDYWEYGRHGDLNTNLAVAFRTITVADPAALSVMVAPPLGTSIASKITEEMQRLPLSDAVALANDMLDVLETQTGRRWYREDHLLTGIAELASSLSHDPIYPLLVRALRCPFWSGRSQASFLTDWLRRDGGEDDPLRDTVLENASVEALARLVQNRDDQMFARAMRLLRDACARREGLHAELLARVCFSNMHGQVYGYECTDARRRDEAALLRMLLARPMPNTRQVRLAAHRALTTVKFTPEDRATALALFQLACPCDADAMRSGFAAVARTLGAGEIRAAFELIISRK